MPIIFSETEYELQKLEKGFKDVGKGKANEIAELKKKVIFYFLECGTSIEHIEKQTQSHLLSFGFYSSKFLKRNYIPILIKVN